MKKVIQRRKLTLEHEVVRQLESSQLTDVVGGMPNTEVTCEQCSKRESGCGIATGYHTTIC